MYFFLHYQFYDFSVKWISFFLYSKFHKYKDFDFVLPINPKFREGPKFQNILISWKPFVISFRSETDFYERIDKCQQSIIYFV